MLTPWSEETITPYRQMPRAGPFYPHMSPAEAAAAFARQDRDLRDYTTLTCVRNPFDRLVSLYRMIAEVDGIWQMRRSFGIGIPSFDSWVRASRPDGRGGGGRAHQRWRRYGTWSAEHWCAGRIDHVIRLEHLKTDLEPALNAIGISPSRAPHLNGRGPVETSRWYDASLIKVVSDRYAFDLDRFGYAPPIAQAAA